MAYKSPLSSESITPRGEGVVIGGKEWKKMNWDVVGRNDRR